MTTRTMSLTILLIFLLTTSLCSADCNSGDRYEDNLNGTVTDCRTGLIWLKNANCKSASGGVLPDGNGFMSWQNALKWVAGLEGGVIGLCGLSDGSAAGDWRLPTKTEWMAMVANARKQGLIFPALTKGSGVGQWTDGDIFNNVQWLDSSIGYWSSTSYPYSTLNAWVMVMLDGSVNLWSKDNIDHVWPVRGGQVGSFGYLFVE